ncbi:hypothetical protein TUM17576_32790 [Enterobacter hormaechei]|nr:hypothetical protein TUM17576_32790 [Enterobacter hormaechei]
MWTIRPCPTCEEYLAYLTNDADRVITGDPEQNPLADTRSRLAQMFFCVVNGVFRDYVRLHIV